MNPQWISVEERLPPAGEINSFNTHPKKYWLLGHNGISWETLWLNWNFKAMGITHWAEAELPEFPK